MAPQAGNAAGSGGGGPREEVADRPYFIQLNLGSFLPTLQIADEITHTSVILLFRISHESKKAEGGNEGKVLLVLIAAYEMIED